ncbi:hypothetical protein JOC85_003710 [Bacillus mesophilus]|uniref:Uncharacterized protein n=1 Tax=Bacillus mesophilus TaxID=1808955 RepID=A0A6M0QE44_9BACI|nr:hypothetical protein [Bacillus mesophilus]MBM7662899.1 hypothetical protein [Bacillus mesophilus]NEY73488.1 hypothetical protein [Bacillus mesophilus]
MLNNQQRMKQQLDQELQDVTFTSFDKVLQETRPKTFRQRLNSLWNREITIPVLPFATATLLFIGIAGSTIFFSQEEPSPHRQLVEVSGNVYYSDLYEKAVAKK